MPPQASRLKTSDFSIIEKFSDAGRGTGYVLDFSDPTFSQFFRDEIGVNIDDERFAAEGRSKWKRLRSFLRVSDASMILNTLVALWEYRSAVPGLAKRNPLDPETENSYRGIVERFGGSLPGRATTPSFVEPRPPEAVLARLKDQLIEISKMEPRPRGYAFETFLKDVFDAYGLAGKAAFRLVGEQIDGSFEFGHETYLLEAKWQNDKTAAKDLRDFHGKLEGKAAWARGLFVSNSGFTEEGLQSFGNGKRIICMDGLDLYEIFHNRRSFVEVFGLKLRAAVETGRPFVRVRDLYPCT
jgi:hypothetical protein